MNTKKGALILLILFLMISLVQATKIEVSTTKETFSTGEDITLKVSLLNDENTPINDNVLIILEDSEKIKTQVSKLDICPLCKTKMTKEHVDHIIKDSDENISKSKKFLYNNNKFVF